MKSLDVVVLCKIFILQSTGHRDWTYSRLAEEACLSVSEAHAAVRRLKAAHLFDEFTKSVIPSAMLEFLTCGLKYAFAADVGAPARGVATSHSAPVLREEVVQSTTDAYVWGYGKGRQKGISVKPLSKNTPLAALRDPTLYDFLALIDAIRLGKAREREIAVHKLIRMIREMAGDGEL
jgi:DNA-binding Lrp family transcriptional regulator